MFSAGLSLTSMRVFKRPFSRKATWLTNSGSSSKRLMTSTMGVSSDICNRISLTRSTVCLSKPSKGPSMTSMSGLLVRALVNRTFRVSPVESLPKPLSSRVSSPNSLTSCSRRGVSSETSSSISLTGVPSLTSSVISLSSRRRSRAMRAACDASDTRPTFAGVP